MAFRRRFSGSRQRSSKARLPLRWSGTLDTAMSGVIPAATLDSQAIIVPADYQQGTAMEASACTLMRIRGFVNLQNTAATVNLVTMCIYVAHGDLAARNPTIFDQAFRYGGTLWHMQLLLPSTAYAGFNEMVELDIKSKRRLENQSVVFAVIGVTTFQYATSLRALLKAT